MCPARKAGSRPGPCGSRLKATHQSSLSPLSSVLPSLSTSTTAYKNAHISCFRKRKSCSQNPSLARKSFSSNWPDLPSPFSQDTGRSCPYSLTLVPRALSVSSLDAPRPPGDTPALLRMPCSGEGHTHRPTLRGASRALCAQEGCGVLSFSR